MLTQYVLYIVFSFQGAVLGVPEGVDVFSTKQECAEAGRGLYHHIMTTDIINQIAEYADHLVLYCEPEKFNDA